MLLALGTPLPTYVKPWKYFEVDALMVSAYYILKNRSIRRKVFEKGLKDYLDYDGMIVLDSGVFQLINSGKEVNVEEIIEVYRRVEDVDIKLSFDYPDDKILEHYLKMKPYEVEPVIPADKHDLIDYFHDDDCEWIFVGRLAKKLKEKGRWGFNFLENVSSMFNQLSEKKLWAMGVGNYYTLPFLEKANFSGSDTSSYRVAAAFGDILVPKKGTQHISGRKEGKKDWGMKVAKNSDLELMLNHIGFTYNDLKESFRKRAIFNAYVLSKVFTL